MEWNEVLLWIVGMSCGVTLLTAGRARPVLRGYAVVSLLIAGLMAGLYWARPEWAGIVGGVLWGLFLVAPSLLQRQASKYGLRQQYHKAARWMTVVSWLHPADGVPQQARLLRALDAAETRGSPEVAIAAFDTLSASRQPRIARAARLYRARFTNDWEDGLVWTQANVPLAQLLTDASLLGLYVRGLGETGRLSDMLLAANAARITAHPALAPARALIRLIALSFSGEVSAVDRLLRGPLAELPSAVKAYWLATAEIAAGSVEAGQARLTAAANDPATLAGTRAAIAYRQSHLPPQPAEHWTDADRLQLRRLMDQVEHEERYLPHRRTMGRPWATYALIVANVIMFIVELQQGGATDENVLVRLGALVPEAFSNHEYRRFFWANFLHFGTAHLVMNMLGIYVLGPYVEFSLGRVKYLAVYLLAGIATMVSVGEWMSWRGQTPYLLVGASGAIMAMIGATAAVLLRGWLRGGANVAMRRLRSIGLILLVQVVFDNVMPQVSGSAHLMGAAWGFVLTIALPLRAKEPRTK